MLHKCQWGELKVKDYFTIGEAAKAANTTSETLRHYDRIGLVRPGKKDDLTGYRYYTDQDIVRLNTVRALQIMDLSLQEIKQVLEYDDLDEIVEFLKRAERKADDKIAALQYSKAKICLAKEDYERKLRERQVLNGISVVEIPMRVIMISDTLESPTLGNLWGYLRHFYDNMAPDVKDSFEFEDMAGIYSEGESSHLFAICKRYADVYGLKCLPGGKYLCARCSDDARELVTHELLRMARVYHGVEPEFTVQLILVKGILQWDYEVQVCISAQ